MGNDKYYSQHMHMHSIYEPGASMEGHIFHARNAGQKYIWFTEHDVFWGNRVHEKNSFDFEGGEIYVCDEDGDSYGFFPTREHTCGYAKAVSDDSYTGSYSMKIGASKGLSEKFSGYGVYTRDIFTRSLCRLVTMSFACKLAAKNRDNVRVIFDFALSERPPEQRKAHLLFVCGSTEGLSAPHTHVVPVDISSNWSLMSLNISDAASSNEAIMAGIGGMDNVLSFLTVRVETRLGEEAELWLDDFSINCTSTPAQTHKRQAEIAAEIGKEYGVTPFVTAEISAGMHKGCFTTDTPVFNYWTEGPSTTHIEACRTMSERNLVFSINHPFVKLLKRKDKNNIDYDAECRAVIDEFAESNAYGATLLEVGFPFGRYAPLWCHLKLWDELCLRGVILTGYGATDSHMMTEGWYNGNNFANFVGIDEHSEPSEAEFVNSMRKGLLYAANPFVIKGDVSFFADGGRKMGSVNKVSQDEKIRLFFSMAVANHNWRIDWIVNGECKKSEKLTRDGYFGEYELEASGGIDFVRVEIYDNFGVLLLLSNPIYFTSDMKNIKNDISYRITE